MNELVLKWLDPGSGRQVGGFPRNRLQMDELGRLAQKFYRDYEGIPYLDLIERMGVAKARIVSLVEARSNDNLYSRSWYEKWTMGRMI